MTLRTTSSASLGRQARSMPVGTQPVRRDAVAWAVMFGVGPLYLFLLHNRLPVGFMRNGWLSWCSTMGTNLPIATMLALLIATVGLRPFLWVYVPTVLLATAAGVWLLYVQHQFEQTYWAKGKRWNAHDAALYGSSHYQLLAVIRWFTANIGMHHVHHLSSRIPFYRLPEVLRDHKDLVGVAVSPCAQASEAYSLPCGKAGPARLVQAAAVDSPVRRGFIAGRRPSLRHEEWTVRLAASAGKRGRSSPILSVHPLLHLLRRQVLFQRGDSPDVACGI